MQSAGTLTVACVQMNSGANMTENLHEAERGIAEAARQGAQLIALPECSMLMEDSKEGLLKHSYTEADHPAIEACSAMAKKYNCWIAAGSLQIIPEKKAAQGKVYNRSIVFNDKGELAGRYDKIHLFDAEVGAQDSNGGSYRESARYQAGHSPVIVPSPWGGLGLTICYDLRFPALYRYLAQQGAHILMVPSAFTKVTGQAHWEILLRARAIETGSFVIAPAQCGTHPGGRETYGHSLMIDPWGRILAEANGMPGILIAELEMDKVMQCREKIPAWKQNAFSTNGGVQR